MRKYTSLISFVILTSLFTACSGGGTGKKTDISKINTPCDCIDAYDKFTGEMLLLLDEKKKLKKENISEYLDEDENVLDERYAKIYDKRDNLKKENRILINHCNEFDEFSEFLKNLEHLNNSLPECKNSASFLTKMERIKYMGFWDKSFF